MKLRSLLFVPCDRPERMLKAQRSQADVVILDLEDSVAPERKVGARAVLRSFLANEERQRPTFVRINPLSSGLTRTDLEALIEVAPDGLVLPKASGRQSIDQLDALLQELGLGSLPIIPIATETAAAIFEIGSYREVAHRLLALTWGAEDLSSAIGASTARETDGRFTPPYELTRSLSLFGAHAAGVAAIETVHPDFKDLDSLARFAARAARDGFSGMMAIHPSQIDTINAAFSPPEADLIRARAIVAAFAAHPEAGVLSLDGEMIDAPHLTLAQRLLDRAAGD
jgi:citrate lyase subunit beta / citryl-CoA lyase